MFEIVTPVNNDGTYTIADDEPFGPDTILWIYTGSFHSILQGGAFRLPNGNTLITDCDDAHMFEVTTDHEVVWEHQFDGGQTFIARAQKYSMDYLGGDFPDYTLGDINFDGLINIIDVLFITDMLYSKFPANMIPSNFPAKYYCEIIFAGLHEGSVHVESCSRVNMKEVFVRNHIRG